MFEPSTSYPIVRSWPEPAGSTASAYQDRLLHSSIACRRIPAKAGAVRKHQVLNPCQHLSCECGELGNLLLWLLLEPIAKFSWQFARFSFCCSNQLSCTTAAAPSGASRAPGLIAACNAAAIGAVLFEAMHSWTKSRASSLSKLRGPHAPSSQILLAKRAAYQHGISLHSFDSLIGIINFDMLKGRCWSAVVRRAYPSHSSNFARNSK